MDTGLLIGLVGLMLTFVGLMVKMAMDYQKTKSGIEALNLKMCEHIERNDDEHKKFAAVEERLLALHIDVKIIIDRLTRRKSDAIEE